MKQIILTLLSALLPAIARADVVAYYTTGASLYVRFDDASNTAVNLTEGSSLKLGRYTAADAAINSAGLAAGTYSGRILIGTAGAQASGDVEVAIVPEFIFGASTQTTSYQNMLAQIIASTPLAGFFTNQPEASVTLDEQAIDDLVDGLVEAGAVASPISPIGVNEARKWKPDPLNASQAGNIVTVKAPFDGTLAALMPLNPDADIASVTSVTITGPAAVTATSLRKSGNGREAHFSTSADVTTTGNYSVVFRVLTVDGDDVSMACRLVVK